MQKQKQMVLKTDCFAICIVELKYKRRELKDGLLGKWNELGDSLACGGRDDVHVLGILRVTFG